jgi:hypothetical protein
MALFSSEWTPLYAAAVDSAQRFREGLLSPAMEGARAVVAGAATPGGALPALQALAALYFAVATAGAVLPQMVAELGDVAAYGRQLDARKGGAADGAPAPASPSRLRAAARALVDAALAVTVPKRFFAHY